MNQRCHSCVSGERRSSLAPLASRRSSSEVIKRMLYGSATKDDLKNRNSMDDDDDESDVTSDDMEESRRQQSRTLPRFFLKKTTSHQGRLNKLRRNSVEDSSERDGSPSPPLDPERTRMNLDHQDSRPRIKTLPRRTKSSSNNNIVSSSSSPGNRKTSYAFGSSTERFRQDSSDTRSSSDNLSGPTHFFMFSHFSLCKHIEMRN